MTVEEVISRLNVKAAASHGAYLQNLKDRGDPEAGAAMLSRYNALLDAIEIVRQIHAEESA